MSSLIVKVCIVDKVEKHSNADKLEICQIRGWKVITVKDQFKEGDKCVYFPPDTVMPKILSDRLGVTKYLHRTANNPNEGRVKVARLRGEKSYGLIMVCENLDWELEHDVANFYNVTKWEPPQRCTDGDAEKPHVAFIKYTDIENYRNFPDVIKEGEEVVFSEKLHGSNARLACIVDNDEQGNSVFKFMVGSHNVRRKEIGIVKRALRDEEGNIVVDSEGNYTIIEETRKCQFWECLTDNVKNLLQDVSENKYNVILFGEMIGKNIQDMDYNVKFGFRAFDILVNDKYLDFDQKQSLFIKHSVESVPILYRGPFSKQKVEEFVDGFTTMCLPEQAGNFKGREGIVITPTKERNDFTKYGGRVILKAVSFDYLNRKGGTEDH